MNGEESRTNNNRKKNGEENEVADIEYLEVLFLIYVRNLMLYNSTLYATIRT